MRKFLLLILSIILVVSTSLFIACAPNSGNNGDSTPGNSVTDTGSNGSQNSGSQGTGNSSSNPKDDPSDNPTDDPSDNPTDGEKNQTVYQVKALIDANPDGVSVEFCGVVVGFDSMGYAHVGDDTGIIYVRAKHVNLIKGAYVKITGTGYVYTGSASYPEYTRQIKGDDITVEPIDGAKPNVKPAITLLSDTLRRYDQSNMLTATFQGNLVTLTGTVSVGKDKYTYYLLDDNGNVMVGLHHYSQFFNNSVEDAQNQFNALNGKKITIEGVIYRFYTKENIWTFQYISDALHYQIVDQNDDVEPTVCPVCGEVIVNQGNHAPLACGHNACEDGRHEICTTCGEYLCNGTDHSHGSTDWCAICGHEYLIGDTSHTTFMACGHNKCLQNAGEHTACAVCGGFVCDGNEHEHTQVMSIDDVKKAIDQYPDGVLVAFEGFVIGEDARGNFYVADVSGAVFVYAYAGNFNVEIGDYVRVKGRGYVYRGSQAYPEYTRQIDREGLSVTELDSGATLEAMPPMLITKHDLETTTESADISNPIHGNPVQITGYLSVGDDIYSYYLVDEEGNRLVGLHHRSKHFNESTDEYRNLFNAFDGQEITLTGVIYRYYTAENIWTFQYISQIEPNYQEEGVIDGIKYEVSSDGTYAIAKERVYGYFSQIVEVATHYNGLTVEEIADWCFANKTELLNVIIPSTVRVIGRYAFEDCKHLNQIWFNEGSRLTTIESNAFENCKNLKNINLPSTLTTIGYAAFRNTGVEELTLPGGLENVGSDAFEGCVNLVKVNYEGGVDDWAKINFENVEAHPMSIVNTINFAGQTVGQKLTITYATYIGRYAFYNFSNVTEIVLPTTVTDIGYGAFKGCNSVVKLTMPCIELDFYNNSTNSRLQLLFGERGDIPASLTTVVFNQAERVYTAYFRGCSNITTVVLPETVTVIEDSAFEDCTSLSNINLPDAITMINYDAFRGCESLTEVDLPVNLETIGGWAFAFTGITTIKIPFKTTAIGSNAFNGCESLKTICIHANLESLGESVFSSTVTTVYFTGAETWEEFTQKVGGLSRTIPGTKVHVSSYTLD